MAFFSIAEKGHLFSFFLVLFFFNRLLQTNVILRIYFIFIYHFFIQKYVHVHNWLINNKQNS